MGSEQSIETVHGPVTLKISEGTQPGDILSVRGKGAYTSSGYGRGNLLIEIKVQLPKRSSKKIKEIAQDLGMEGY